MGQRQRSLEPVCLLAILLGVRLLDATPVFRLKANATADTKWCGPLAVAGNTVASMPGQGSGCMPDNHTRCSHGGPAENCTNWCNKQPPPWSGVYPPATTIGGQCGADERALPPPCDASPRFAPCRAAPGVAGACYTENTVRCIAAAELANSGGGGGGGGGGGDGGGDLCPAGTRCTFFE